MSRIRVYLDRFAVPEAIVDGVIKSEPYKSEMFPSYLDYKFVDIQPIEQGSELERKITSKLTKMGYDIVRFERVCSFATAPTKPKDVLIINND